MGRREIFFIERYEKGRERRQGTVRVEVATEKFVKGEETGNCTGGGCDRKIRRNAAGRIVACRCQSRGEPASSTEGRAHGVIY